MRRDEFDPARLRIAEQVLDKCERLGVTVFARNGTASGVRIVNGDALPPPPKWDRMLNTLGPEIAWLLDWRASFLCYVERVAGGCRLYRLDWGAHSACPDEPPAKPPVVPITGARPTPNAPARLRSR